MIEYWEAIGRLATDAQLTTDFETLMASQPAAQVVTVHANDDMDMGPATGLNISGPTFNAVQDFWTPVLTEKVMSMMAAGELIWTYNSDDSRGALKSICQLKSKVEPQLTGASTGYYIALGRALVDDYVFQDLVDPKADTAKLLPRLTPVEIAQLLALLAMDEFKRLKGVFQLIWTKNCASLAVFWPGYIQPMGINAQETCGHFRAVPRNVTQAQAAAV